jgi:hypothetical protein
MSLFSGSFAKIKISISHCSVKVKSVIEGRLFTKKRIRKATFPPTLALSIQGRGNLTISPPLRGGDKGEGVEYVLTYSVIVSSAFVRK